MNSKGHQILQRLKFDKNDLEHNRRGELSDKQKALIRKGGRNGAYVFAATALIMTPILWFAADDMGQFAILETVVAIFLGLLAMFSIRIMNKDAKVGVVESIVGRPSIKTKMKGGKIRKVFFIGEREFSDKWLHSLLNENAVYRAYYVPESGKLVSIELAKKS